MEDDKIGYKFTFDNREYILPPELLRILFMHLDNETLVNCQLVCRSWLADIRNYVWRKKVELKFRKSLSGHNLSWKILYSMCKTENPFEKNLLKNHSGESGFQYWNNVDNQWVVENPPVNAPELPVDKDPIFEGKQFCFAVNFNGKKCQTVNLVDAGFHPYILDNLLLPIEISEWCCIPRKDLFFNKIHYMLSYTDMRFDHDDLLLKEEDVEQENEWMKKTYDIRNEKKGLRGIFFVNHGESYISTRKCKIAGSCIKVKFPCITASDSSSDSSNDLQKKM